MAKIKSPKWVDNIWSTPKDTTKVDINVGSLDKIPETSATRYGESILTTPVTKADDTKPSWTNFDWMKPRKYTKAEGIDVLQTMYPHVDFKNIKLGDKPTQTRVIRKSQYIKPRYQSRSGELEFGGGYHHLPPSNFMEVLEKFRLGGNYTSGCF